MIILSAIAFRASEKEDAFQYQTNRRWKNFSDIEHERHEEGWRQRKLHFEHTLLLTYISFSQWVAYRLSPAHQRVLSSSQECLEMHLQCIIAGQLVQGPGEFCGFIWCSALARSQNARCRLQGLYWDRADKPCWTWAEPVQRDITVVDYMISLAVSDFFPY